MNWRRFLSKSVDLSLWAVLCPVSEKRRYPIALKIGRLVQPVTTNLYRHLRGCDFDVQEAYALRQVLLSATRAGCTFSPPVRVAGASLVHEGYARGRGLVLCSGHFHLNGIMVRKLWDWGYHPSVVHNSTGFLEGRSNLIPGTRHESKVILTSAYTLIQARRELKRGGVVVAEIDADTPLGDVTAFECRGKTRYIHHGMFELARHLQASLLFFATTLAEDGWINIVVGRPDCRLEGEASPESCAKNFALFLKKQL